MNTKHIIAYKRNENEENGKNYLMTIDATPDKKRIRIHQSASEELWWIMSTPYSD